MRKEADQACKATREVETGLSGARILALLFGMRGLRMIPGHFRLLLRLRGMFFALSMFIFAVSIGGRAMRFGGGFVMFRCLIVFVFHGDFSCCPTNFGRHRSDLNSGRTEFETRL
jgi:hypothetical protein